MLKKSFKMKIRIFFFLLIIFSLVSCGSKKQSLNPAVLLLAVSNNSDSSDEDDPEPTVWTGPALTFEKKDGSDPALESNQDKITDKVWITRSLEGGQIYNAKIETKSHKDESPKGTRWAKGKAKDWKTLTFRRFRETLEEGGKKIKATIINTDLVLHLVDENIYIDIKFTKWSSGKKGGFEYTRSTKN